MGKIKVQHPKIVWVIQGDEHVYGHILGIYSEKHLAKKQLDKVCKKHGRHNVREYDIEAMVLDKPFK